MLQKNLFVFLLVRAVDERRERNLNDVEESRSRAEAEKAGQADHSLSDINPIVGFVGFYLQPTLTGHISGSSDCWRKTDRERKGSVDLTFDCKVTIQ